MRDLDVAASCGRLPGVSRITERPSFIENLYRAFADCTIPERMSYCTYCDSEEHERALHAPLTTLPNALMNKYLSDAIHHTGDAADFAYFIPRIIELEYWETIDRFSHLPGCLTMAQWHAWPGERQAALRSALESMACEGTRSDEWLDIVAEIENIAWEKIFPRLPNLDNPRSEQSEWLWMAIHRRCIMDGSRAIDRAFLGWLESPDGARFAEEFLSRATLS